MWRRTDRLQLRTFCHTPTNILHRATVYEFNSNLTLLYSCRASHILGSVRFTCIGCSSHESTLCWIYLSYFPCMLTYVLLSCFTPVRADWNKCRFWDRGDLIDICVDNKPNNTSYLCYNARKHLWQCYFIIYCALP